MRFVLLKVIIMVYFFSSCKRKEVQFIRFNNPKLEKIINNYIEIIEKRNKLPQDLVIDVNFKKNNDTIIVTLVDTYPDLRYEKYNAHTLIKRYSIFLMGDTNKSLYEASNFKTPPQSLLKSQEEMFDKNNPPSFYEPVQWIFYFVKDSIVGYQPKAEIDRAEVF